jgi:hypothetical protein
VRFGALFAESGFFATFQKCFRAGLFWGQVIDFDLAAPQGFEPR